MPGEPDPAAKVDPTIGIDRWFEIASVNSSCRYIRRRIVSAMPPGARPWIRPDTVTVIVGSCRIRASMRASAWTNARSSPDAIAGMPPARSNAATVTARLAPAASVWRGQGSAGSGSSLAASWSCNFVSSHSSASSAWRCAGISAASVGSTATRPHTRSAPAASDRRFRSIQSGRDDGIGIRCQKYAVVTRKFGGVFHCQPARIAGVGGNRRECVDSNYSGYGRRSTTLGPSQRCRRYSCWPAGAPHRLASSAVRARKDKPRYDRLRPWQGSRQR